ncbi:GntR family transcriptional regulator [Sinorhizobium medicae]|uniref:GntR family transcriptional regulator n=1 Tax=Sinorhizobium medicae TaxID=110321 RepID=UPI000FD92AC4|nr:GntR family transcriptional regulator [Sinorhizobium medicae]RVJ84941.1 GntR family transcriptional regulator [Sinorhizobium medicae]
MSAPLRQIAYENFKNRLFDRTLIPGRFLSQRELCDILESPMGAVREALKRLEAEGLINILPQRGVQITDINLSLINEAFQFRLLIEQESARKMAGSPNRAELAELRERTQNIRSRAERADASDQTYLKDGLEVDLALHDMLVAHFDNSLISGTHRIIQDRVRLIRSNKNYTTSRLVDAMSEHLAIIDALLATDENAAVAALKSHLTTSWRRALGHEDLSS